MNIVPATVLKPPDAPLYDRLAKGTLWSIAGAVVSRGLTLIAMIFVGRVLGPTAFGEFGIIQSTIGMFGAFAGAGLGLTATKCVAETRSRERHSAGQYISLMLKTAFIGGAMGTAVLFFLAPPLATDFFLMPSLVLELRVAAILVFVGAITAVQTGALAGLEGFRTAAFVGILRAVCVALAAAAGAYLFGLSGAVIGLTLAETVSCLVGQLGLRTACRAAKVPLSYSKSERERWGALWRFAVPAFLSGIVIQPAIWLSNLLLAGQPQGYAALGVFNAADRYLQLLLFLPASISSAILSILSNLHGSNDSVGYRKVFVTNLCITLAAVVIPGVCVIAVAPLAMSAFGSAYLAGSTALVILACTSVVVVLNSALGQVLVSSGRIWWRFGLDLLLAFTLVACSWWWIPLHRENGLALANLAAFGVVSLVLALAAHRVLLKKTGQPSPLPDSLLAQYEAQHSQ